MEGSQDHFNSYSKCRTFLIKYFIMGRFAYLSVAAEWQSTKLMIKRLKVRIQLGLFLFFSQYLVYLSSVSLRKTLKEMIHY